MSDLTVIKRALISVSDKTGLEDLAIRLVRAGVQLLSTGGTAKFLRDRGLSVTDVSDVTGFPEMMDGRVKTLHPMIHGALLGLRNNADHVAAMETHGITPIDLLVVNLYPFEATIAQEGVELETAVENIDIGGPAMIRSAAKNWRDVAVVTDPRLYGEIIDEIETNGGALSIETRQRLAALAFTRTASYDLAISSYLARQLSNDDLERLEPYNPLGGLVFIESEDEPDDPFAAPDENAGMAEFRVIELAKVRDLRYGENPHQSAALYRAHGGGITDAEQLHGKEMSFNNYVDAEAAWNLVNDFCECAAAIIKHTNPSGVGTGGSNHEAYSRALATDPVSAFGGIVAFNRRVDAAVAASVNEVFTEVVIAPEFDEEAIDIFRQKKNLRVLRAVKADSDIGHEYKQISGGMLIQDSDSAQVTAAGLKHVTTIQPTAEQIAAMLFAWTVCKHIKSNAIVLARPGQTIGVGAGQMNRVDSIRIAATRAQRFDLPTEGSVLASDAFFPFRDNVDEAAALGVSAIIQPGGSVKDAESIAAANEHGIAMAFTGVRHFKH